MGGGEEEKGLFEAPEYACGEEEEEAWMAMEMVSFSMLRNTRLVVVCWWILGVFEMAEKPIDNGYQSNVPSLLPRKALT